MRTIAGVLLVLLAAPLTAAAQPGMYAAPPPSTAPEPVPVVQESKARLEIGLIAASPKGDDWKMLGAETSPGFHLQLGIAVAPNVSLFGGLRYVSVELGEESETGIPESFELTHRELQLGLRYTSPMSPTSKFFLEGNVHSATVTASFEGDSESVSGAGLGVRGGFMFNVGSRIDLGIALGYSSADVSEDDSDEFEDSWLTGDAFLSFGF